jgi:hypothetical protein
VVFVPQCFKDSDFDLSLLVQLLPVFENFQGYSLLALVIIASHDYTECTLAKFFLYFISVIDLFLGFVKVIGLVVIKSVIKNCICLLRCWILILTIYFTFYKLTNSLVLGVQIKVVDGIKRSDLFSLILGKIPAIYSQGIIRAHGKG